MKEIPGPRGPIQTARLRAGMLRRPQRTLLRLYREFGPTVGYRAGQRPVVMLFGPEANRFVFAHDEYFRWRETFEFFLPLHGETALVVSDGEVHRRRRRLVMSAFGRGSVEGYVPTFTTAADRVIDRWVAGQAVDLHAEFRAAIRWATLSALCGPVLAGDAEELGAAFDPLLRLIEANPAVAPAHRRLRTPVWRAAMAARQRVDGVIHAEIGRRRSAGPDPERTDMLARLVNATAGPGSEGLTDDEVRDQVVSIVTAGYEPTGAGFAWACLALATRPDVADRARREVREVCGDGAPTGPDLAAMPYLAGVVAESLRLWPPAVASMRIVSTGFRFAGHEVHPGTLLQYSPLVSHRMPEVWADPERFAPERWVDRPVRPPEEYLPFGGGRHRCVGATLATVEMAAMLARLLTRADFSPLPGSVRPISMIAMRPRGGVPVRVHSIDGRR